MFFIRFSLTEQEDICKIRQQYLSHSFNLIYSTFEKSFKTLKEARVELYNFGFIVGSSQGGYFKIVEDSLKGNQEYLKGLVDLRGLYG